MELDTRLRIRKADHMAGLVMGLPPAMLLKRPLHHFLHIDKHTSWDAVMEVKARKGVLKKEGGANSGIVTKQLSFEGLHPDGGASKLTMQGVAQAEGLGSRTRVLAILRQDHTFVGAKANLFKTLGLQAGAEYDALSEMSEEVEVEDDEEAELGLAVREEGSPRAAGAELDDMEDEEPWEGEAQEVGVLGDGLIYLLVMHGAEGNAWGGIKGIDKCLVSC